MLPGERTAAVARPCAHESENKSKGKRCGYARHMLRGSTTRAACARHPQRGGQQGTTRRRQGGGGSARVRQRGSAVLTRRCGSAWRRGERRTHSESRGLHEAKKQKGMKGVRGAASRDTQQKTWEGATWGPTPLRPHSHCAAPPAVCPLAGIGRCAASPPVERKKRKQWSHARGTLAPTGIQQQAPATEQAG